MVRGGGGKGGGGIVCFNVFAEDLPKVQLIDESR